MPKFHLPKFVIKGEKWHLYNVLFLLMIAMGLSTNIYAKNSEIVKQFLNKTFQYPTPKVQKLWINKKNRQIIKQRFNPNHINLNYKYWQQDHKTVWILNEIGKERNITTGIVIQDQKIQHVEVLIYRETRGRQVKNPRFTQQYKSKTINSNLIKEIDSISGATLSVNALNRQVKLALWLDFIKNRLIN